MKLRNTIVMAAFSLIMSAFSADAAAEQAKQTSYTIIDLGNLGSGFSQANAVNNRGEVVGFSSLKTPQGPRAFLYSNGQMQDLGLFPNGLMSQATAINNRGQVVGFSQLAVGNAPIHAFLYSGGPLQDLTPDLPNGTTRGDSRAFGINNRNEIVGVYTFGNPDNGITHGFLYRDGILHDLGTLVTLPISRSEAFGINERGQIVGDATVDEVDLVTHAFLYSGGKLQDLGTFNGLANTQATAINNRSEVVGNGFADRNTFPRVPFLYRGGQMRDLNSFLPTNSGWVLFNAQGINDRGQIWDSSLGEQHHCRYNVRFFLAKSANLGRVGSFLVPPQRRVFRSVS